MAHTKKKMFATGYHDTLLPGLDLATRTQTGQNTGTGLCAVGAMSKACYLDVATPLEVNVGDTVYNSNQTALAGNNKWYLVALAIVDAQVYNVQVDNSGVITTITEC